jgi:hypothetical protein
MVGTGGGAGSVSLSLVANGARMHLEGIVGSGRRRAALAALAACECAAAQAWAQEDRGAPAGPSAPASAQQSASVGAFSSWTTTARSDSQRATARVTAGYVTGGRDGADGATFDGGAEVQLMNRVAVRAAASSAPASASSSSASSSSASPSSKGLALRFEGKLDALRQETNGVDLAITGGYESRGFNEVPALAGTLALGHSQGRLQLLANVGYARGLEDSEQYGSAGLAGIYQASQQLQLGLDSRLRVDLERDADEPPGEREWELLAGPTVTFSVGSLAVIGGTGLAVNQLRLQPGLNVGAIGYLGLGAAF